MKLSITELTRRATVTEGQKVPVNIAQARELIKCFALEISKAIDNREITEEELLKIFSQYVKKIGKKK